MPLFDVSYEALVDSLAEFGQPSFRADQIHHASLGRGLSDFAHMYELPRSLREALPAHFSLARPAIIDEQCSEDGTCKWCLGLVDGRKIETVFIPQGQKGALCLSSQVGCTLTCRFCHTGTQRLERHLTAGEILGQIIFARDHLQSWPSNRPDQKITHIVFMGMGEPLYNYDQVLKALSLFEDKKGLAIHPRRVTLSTAGVVPMIPRLARDYGCNLAISLHAVTDELRDRLVPLNRAYPIAELLTACREWCQYRPRRRLTFEYVMLDQVNDSDSDARSLIRLVAGFKEVRINLIPFNPWPGSVFTGSSACRVLRFSKRLQDSGLIALVRQPRGRDVLAACGQLRSSSPSHKRIHRNRDHLGCANHEALMPAL